MELLIGIACITVTIRLLISNGWSDGYRRAERKRLDRLRRRVAESGIQQIY